MKENRLASGKDKCIRIPNFWPILSDMCIHQIYMIKLVPGKTMDKSPTAKQKGAEPYIHLHRRTQMHYPCPYVVAQAAAQTTTVEQLLNQKMTL
uniref:Uncharacterized protein n=1 Tax=Setaria digitata TaxID=48799 RepID=A0A915PGR9_9BILA